MLSPGLQPLILQLTTGSVLTFFFSPVPQIYFLRPEIILLSSTKQNIQLSSFGIIKNILLHVRWTSSCQLSRSNHLICRELFCIVFRVELVYSQFCSLYLKLLLLISQKIKNTRILLSIFL